MKSFVGQAITVRGPVEPAALGAMMMHEHLHSDCYDWERMQLVTEEKPPTPERRQFLLDQAVPLLRACHDHGMHGYVDTTPAPWRAHATLYKEVSEQADCHMVVCTGFYREIELGRYWARTPDEAIWPFARRAPLEELAEFCIRDIAEGMHGTAIRAGALKLGTSQAPLTDTEKKCLRAVARAQLETGVHITTHCTVPGAETSQLTLLEEAGVDLSRVVIGHAAWHLSDKGLRRTCLEWMKRGANFLPTNLGVTAGKEDVWRPLVEGIHDVFQAGHGGQLVLGLDSGYCSESGAFQAMTFLPPHPWTHMFVHTLPAFRALGLTADEERAMMVENPQRIVPVR